MTHMEALEREDATGLLERAVGTVAGAAWRYYGQPFVRFGGYMDKIIRFAGEHGATEIARDVGHVEQNLGQLNKEWESVFGQPGSTHIIPGMQEIALKTQAVLLGPAGPAIIGYGMVLAAASLFFPAWSAAGIRLVGGKAVPLGIVATVVGVQTSRQIKRKIMQGFEYVAEIWQNGSEEVVEALANPGTGLAEAVDQIIEPEELDHAIAASQASLTRGLSAAILEEDDRKIAILLGGANWSKHMVSQDSDSEQLKSEKQSETTDTQESISSS